MFKFIPTQDGINHVYNAYVLKDYHKQENTRLHEFFELNLSPFPNWTSHALMALLMYFVPPLISEKILVSLCIILLPIALFYLLDAVNKGRVFLSLFGFIFAYSYLLHLGFYNFVLSMSMFLFTLGYWWKHKNNMKLTNIALLYVLLLGTYFCHYLSFLLVVISLSFFAFVSFICSSSNYETFIKSLKCHETRTRLFNSLLTGLWGKDKKLPESNLNIFVKCLKVFLKFLTFMLPVYIVTLSYYWKQTQHYRFEYEGINKLVQYFFNMGSLISFRAEQIIVGRVLLFFFAVLIFSAVWHKLHEIQKFRTKNNEQLLPEIMEKNVGFLIMAIIITVIYFIVPRELNSDGGSGGGWINDRFHIYIFLILLPFLNIKFHKFARYIIVGCIVILYFWHLSHNVYAYYYFNKEMIEMTSGVDELEEHATLAVYPDERPLESKYLGEWEKLSPFLHLPSYFCINNGVVYLKNYEAIYNYFPINFKNKGNYGSRDADYVLIWQEDYNAIGDFLDEYVIFHSGKHYRIYHKKIPH